MVGPSSRNCVARRISRYRLFAVPKMLGSLPADRWERVVYRSLKQQLPDDWVVVSNVGWSLPVRGSYIRDGQADFVVLAPNIGMVVIEVKGTSRFWIGDDGRWYREDPLDGTVEVPEPPPAQATRNMYDLVEIVQKQGKWARFPGRFSYVVVYPNGEASRIPAMFDSSTLVTARHLNQLSSAIRASVERRGFGERGQQMSAQVVGKIADLLTSHPFIVMRTDTADDRAIDIDKVTQLTRQQFAALRGVFDLPRVAVLGPAGSGKTLLAIWRLRAVLEQDRRALYVCYNKDLATHLRKRNSEIADAITSVDKLFTDLVPDPLRGDITTWFREMLPGRVIDAADSLSPDRKYDAVIVDEGQDFGEYRLLALDALLRGNTSQWLFFADWRQDLFRAGKKALGGAEVMFTLHHNCRNTRRVNDGTNAYLGQLIESMPGAPDGLAPEIIRCRDERAVAERAFKLASEWNDCRYVAILSPRRREHSVMSRISRAYGLEIVESLDGFGRPGTVYFSTIRAFKGIEADAVILVDVEVPGASPIFAEEDLYVACTRPTGRLAVLVSSDQAERWFSRADSPLHR